MDKILRDNLPMQGENIIPYHHATVKKLNPDIEMAVNGVTYHSPLFGEYNAVNILCAVTTGLSFGVSSENIKKAISAYVPKNNRSEIRSFRGARIILDAYNANPTSMEESLRNFDSTSSSPKMVILGDMLELGEYSMKEHEFIYRLSKKLGFDRIILVGELFYELSVPGLKFRSVTDAKVYLDTLDIHGWHILIKGSRAIGLEKLIFGED